MPVSEVQLDWFIVPDMNPSEPKNSEQKKKVEVLLVAVHKDELALLQSIVTGAGLRRVFMKLKFSARYAQWLKSQLGRL